MRCFREICRGVAALGLAWAAWPGGLAAAEPEGVEFFENHIRPLLAQNCYKCHSAEAGKAKGELLLDTRDGLRRGGDSGPAVVPGDPKASLLIRAVSYENDDLQMPPKNRLPQDAIDRLAQWIAMGAPDPRDGKAADITDKDAFDIAGRKAEHWAWQPVRRDVQPPSVQPVRGAAWASTAIDRFILAKLQAAGLSPSEMATRRTLIRRLHFDLIGLPPTPGEVEAFVADPSATAYEAAVERLLASPHFGERWGQHWLDIVRFAETRGHEADYPIPEAYRYRNYVVRAFNADVPYADFVVEHIAGDRVEPPRIDPATRCNESALGAGFWHLGEATHSPVDIRGDECNRVHNQIDVYSKAFLGMTVGCARCHDHKFDAISTRDYYALAGYLQSSGYHLKDISDPAAQAAARNELAKLRAGSEAGLLREFTASVETKVSRLAGYLPAAAEILRNIPDGSDAPEPGDYIASHPVVRDAAGTKNLQPEKLAAWVAYLDKARADAADPLRGVAGVALGQARAEAVAAMNQLEADTAARAESIRINVTVEEGERNYVKSERDWTASDRVADFRRPQGPEEWFTGGMQFGAGPMAVGTPVYGGDASRPVTEFNENGAARSDRLSTRFTGIIRTRTFGVNGDTLWYRYKGKADVFLAVDSHRQVAGPLHKVVRQKLDSKGDDWKWHSHRVRDYIGHRVHVEFTPRGAFALERVQFGGGEPPIVRPVNSRLAKLLDGGGGLADGLAKLLVAAANDSAAGRADRETAQLLNWVIRHEHLLEKQADLGQATRKFAAYHEAKTGIERTIPGAVWALTLLDGNGEDEPVLVRGNHRTPARETVPRAFLQALGETKRPSRGSGRMDLARRMTDPDNPFVSRVLANRVWHHLFGRGIVDTVDNFGATSRPPTHPALLDYLAAQLIERGWSVKDMIRQVVLSSTYRQSSRPHSAGAKVDPNNYLLHRMPIRRLQGEVIRDQLLAVSGRIDKRQFGKGPMVHITPFMRNNRSPGGSGPMDGDGRRSIYVEVRRNHPEPMLSAFDKPTPFTTMGRRVVSNSPAQPLIMLNNEFVHQQAAIWADALLNVSSANTAELVRLAYRQAFGREPEAWEAGAAAKFLEQQRGATGGGSLKQPLADLCHTLFNVKEFVFVN
ncbi:MAG: PSD1 domain-containing protein [Verrucomicrobia bacterium]|nr:PSD1 domain-containing protein [Verrucomicrobiota bacterium]